MRNFFESRHLWLAATLGAVAIVVLSVAPVGASSANLSHSYKAAGKITNGSLVSLDPKRSDYIQPANTDNGVRLIGVVLASSDSLLAVDATAGQVQVATSGNVPALASTVGGDIHLGDRVSVSPFDGVGMKAAPGSPVIGLAQTTLNSGTQGAVTQSVTDKSGKTKQIKVGLVRVSIAVSAAGDTSRAGNLTGLQKVAKSLTGHEVSTARVLVSLVVAIVSLLALITLIYASIYGSIVSIGRNPLAKYAVFRTLGSVLGMALLTTVVTGVTLFLLLR